MAFLELFWHCFCAHSWQDLLFLSLLAKFSQENQHQLRVTTFFLFSGLQICLTLGLANTHSTFSLPFQARDKLKL